jgi:hypothetical protein
MGFVSESLSLRINEASRAASRLRSAWKFRRITPTQ